jgi:hypothetical protein
MYNANGYYCKNKIIEKFAKKQTKQKYYIDTINEVSAPEFVMTRLNNMNEDAFNLFNPEYVKYININYISSIKPVTLRLFTSNHFNALSVDQLKQFTEVQLSEITEPQFSNHINVNVFKNIGFNKFSRLQYKWLTQAQINSLDCKDINTINYYYNNDNNLFIPIQMSWFSNNVIPCFSRDFLVKLSIDHLNYLNKLYLTTTQIEEIKKNYRQANTPIELMYVPIELIKFSTITIDQFNNYNDEQLTKINPTQVAEINNTIIESLSQPKLDIIINKLSVTQIQKLSKSQVVSINPTTFINLLNKQIVGKIS